MVEVAVGEKLSRETLVDRLGAELRQLIVSERIPAGAAFPSERQLCEAFGVGRTTVREALQGMVATGLLERHNKELLVVDPLTLPGQLADTATLAARLSVKDVFEVRELIESNIVEAAAKHWTPADLENLRQSLDRMRDPRNDEEYHEAHTEFHRLIGRAGKNPVLASVYESSFHLFFKLPAYWRLFGGGGTQPAERKGGQINGWSGHVRLFEAIEARDPEEAVRINNEMNDRIKRKLIRQLNKTTS